MNNPQPINAIKTRVVKVADGSFIAQSSYDSLSWSNIHKPTVMMDTSVCLATSLMEQASRTPSAGEVVWKSY